MTSQGTRRFGGQMVRKVDGFPLKGVVLGEGQLH